MKQTKTNVKFLAYYVHTWRVLTVVFKLIQAIYYARCECQAIYGADVLATSIGSAWTVNSKRW